VPLGSDLRNLSTAVSCHLGRGNLKTSSCQGRRYTPRTRKSKTHKIAKPASRKVSCNFRYLGRPTNRCHAACVSHPEKKDNCEHLRATQRTTCITDLQWATRREASHEPSTVLAVIRDARLHRRVGATISDTTVPRAE